MLSWRGVALGVGLCVGFVAACGDDPAKRTVRGGADAGAAGAGDEPAGAGAGAMPAASGAGGEAGSAPQVGIDLQTYCQAIGEGYSAWLAFCYGTEAYPESEAADFATRNEMRCLEVAPEIEAGRMTFDELAAAACVGTIDTMSCDGFNFVERRSECRYVVTGLVEVGDPCYGGVTHFSVAGGACADGYCDTGGGVCPGECVAFKEDDEPCAGSGECSPDSWCSTDGVCTPRPAVGEACNGDACSFGIICQTAINETEGVCVASSVAGQACDETEPCSFGFFCLGGECHSKVATGEPCEVVWNCADGERCLDREGDGATCGEPGGHDVPCGVPADCVEDHYCGLQEPHVCLPRVALGNTCTADQQCAQGAWCNVETAECQAPGAENESCSTNGFPAGSPSACEAGLKCMNDGLCHPVGGVGDPCHTINMATCEAGLFCSLEDATCQPLAEQGQPCNPYPTVTCAGDLACLCDDPACAPYSYNLPHACAPRRADGEVCFSTNECAIGSSCLGDVEVELECVPDPVPCLSE